MKKVFVFVHDVSPKNAGALRRVLPELARRTEGALHLAAIADDCRQDPVAARALAREAGERFELVGHGVSHAREPSFDPFSFATGRCDELGGLAGDEAERRARTCRAYLEDVFETAVHGFVPPAFRWGNLDLSRLLNAGYLYGLGLGDLRHARGRSKLGTVSWDPGRLAFMAGALELFGRAASLRRGAIPCLVVHPSDVARGHLPRAYAHLDALLASGHEPALARDWVMKDACVPRAKPS